MIKSNVLLSGFLVIFIFTLLGYKADKRKNVSPSAVQNIEEGISYSEKIDSSGIDTFIIFNPTTMKKEFTIIGEDIPKGDPKEIFTIGDRRLSPGDTLVIFDPKTFSETMYIWHKDDE